MPAIRRNVYTTELLSRRRHSGTRSSGRLRACGRPGCVRTPLNLQRSAAKRSEAYDLSAVSNIDPARFILSNEQTGKCTKRKQRTAEGHKCDFEQRLRSASERSGVDCAARSAVANRQANNSASFMLSFSSTPRGSAGCLYSRRTSPASARNVLSPSSATHIAENRPPHRAGKSSKRKS